MKATAKKKTVWNSKGDRFVRHQRGSRQLTKFSGKKKLSEQTDRSN